MAAPTTKKLLELLAEPEQSALEFKTEVALSKPADKLKLVKDLLTLGNNPEGGYLLIGVSDDGSLTLPIGSISDRRAFDAARLNDLISPYVEGVQSTITQVHEHDHHEVVLIFAEPHADGLPLPTSKPGQYQEGKAQTVVFRPGEVFVREGAKNVPLRHAHFARLLTRHDETIRAETRATIDALLSRLVEAPRGPQMVPLDADMPNDVFADAIRVALDSNSESSASRFLSQASNSIAASGGSSDSALHKAAVIAVEALATGRTALAAQAVDSIYRAYAELPRQSLPPELCLRIATYIYVVGSMAVRSRSWQAVQKMALLSGPGDGCYKYSSWIRHMQVEASRAHLFSREDSGTLISAAREMMAKHPELRPDIVGDIDSVDVQPSDPSLNSLCQFDFLYCLWTAARGTGSSGAYPASSAFDERRLLPLVGRFNEEQIRREVFPEVADTDLADAVKEVAELASNQSAQIGRWWRLPNGAAKFVSEHRSR